MPAPNRRVGRAVWVGKTSETRRAPAAGNGAGLQASPGEEVDGEAGGGGGRDQVPAWSREWARGRVNPSGESRGGSGVWLFFTNQSE